MCDHKWVPYVMLTTHPKNIMNGDVYIVGDEIHSLVTTKVKCVECEEEREVLLGEEEKKQLSIRG